jgi:putative acetyltransferase
MNPIDIRVATHLDRENIYDIYMRAFAEDENQLVATLAVNLLNEVAASETFALVAEVGNQLVGHIAFSPVMADSNSKWLGFILAPLAVKPAYQKAGIGSALVRHGIDLLSKKMANAVFVYGDPNYYGQFGFSAKAATRFVTPYPLEYPSGWQARIISEDHLDDPVVKLSCVPALCDPKLW